MVQFENEVCIFLGGRGIGSTRLAGVVRVDIANTVSLVAESPNRILGCRHGDAIRQRIDLCLSKLAGSKHHSAHGIKTTIAIFGSPIAIAGHRAKHLRCFFTEMLHVLYIL